MIELEFSTIKWNIIGLSEVRRKGKGNIILEQHGSHSVLLMAIRTETWGRLRGKQEYFPQCDRFRSLSDKVPDEEVEKVYEEIDNIITSSKAHYTIVMGDFNAKASPGEIRETCTRPYIV